MSLRLTIFSKKDAFSKPVAVVEGRATNGSPDTTADQIARRIVRRMAKALEKQNAF
jgi:S-adenosylmethionine synthetase